MWGEQIQRCSNAADMPWLPSGPHARTRDEVMRKSREDPQYGMGIVENKRKPDNLVDSKDYWEKRCAAHPGTALRWARATPLPPPRATGLGGGGARSQVL